MLRRKLNGDVGADAEELGADSGRQLWVQAAPGLRFTTLHPCPQTHSRAEACFPTALAGLLSQAECGRAGGVLHPGFRPP